jgi:hypothetical protein
VRKYRDWSDGEILSEPVSLATVQFALAMEYGFTTWNHLMEEVEARSGESPFNEPEETASRFRRTRVLRDGATVRLDPIPRYPFTARYLDENGSTDRIVRDRALSDRIVGNLYCAMNMAGAELDWLDVAAASGDIFRVAFEPRWAQDAEYVTDVDHFVQACEILGFRYTKSCDSTLVDALALIDSSLASCRAPLVSGWGERFWRVVVGVDRDRGEYRTVGAVEFEGGIPMADVRPGECLGGYVALEDCPAANIPTTDRHGCVLGPEQVATNPVFVVEEYEPRDTAERIRRTLEVALPLNRDYRLERKNLAVREKAIAGGPPGHDGWKFTFSPWPSTFDMGARALRAWADHVESMAEPTYDFEMIHGIDTTFGGFLRSKHRDIVGWRILPKPDAFVAGKEAAASTLRRLADERDAGFQALEAALQAL